MQWDLGFPATAAVRTSTPEKEVNRKENTVGKIANFEKATDSKVYNAQIECSDTDLAKFYSIT